MTIKLRKNGDYTFISEPSWKKVGKKDLVVWWVYQHPQKIPLFIAK